MRFLESLTGDNMSLCGPARLAEVVSHEASFGNRSQQTDSRFAGLVVGFGPGAVAILA
jgi:hypothetical protein